MLADFQKFGDPGGHGVQVDVSADRDDRQALEPALEKGSPRLILAFLSIGTEADGDDSRLPIPLKPPCE
jgi:hypothetical protein